jgi:hypothetical protein
MATGTNNLTSILGIIALIAVIAAAAYYIMNEADDNELEIDIGFVHDASPRALAASAEGNRNLRLTSVS